MIGDRFLGAVRTGARRSGARLNKTAARQLAEIGERFVTAASAYSGLDERDIAIIVRQELLGTRHPSWYDDPCAIRWFEFLWSALTRFWREGDMLHDQTIKVRLVDPDSEHRYLEICQKVAGRRYNPRPRGPRRGQARELRLVQGGAP